MNRKKEKAILTIIGDKGIVEYLHIQMDGKDAFKDFKVQTVVDQKGLVVLKIQDILMSE